MKQLHCGLNTGAVNTRRQRGILDLSRYVGQSLNNISHLFVIEDIKAINTQICIILIVFFILYTKFLQFLQRSAADHTRLPVNRKPAIVTNEEHCPCTLTLTLYKEGFKGEFNCQRIFHKFCRNVSIILNLLHKQTSSIEQNFISLAIKKFIFRF